MSCWVGSGRGLGLVGDGSGPCYGRLRVKLGGVGSGSGSSRGRVGVVLGSTPCRVGWGRVGVWVESGTSRGRVGAKESQPRIRCDLFVDSLVAVLNQCRGPHMHPFLK